MRKATPEEEDVVRVGLHIHTDDFTVSNPIGVKRAIHKYCMTSGGIINFKTRKRFSWDYLLLLSIVAALVIKKKGMAWVISGRDKEGKEVVSNSLAADLKLLATEGIAFKIKSNLRPTDLDGERTVRLFVYLIAISGDFLASGSLGPTPEAVSAAKPCRDCYWISFAKLLTMRKRNAKAGITLAEDSIHPLLIPAAEPRCSIKLKALIKILANRKFTKKQRKVNTQL